MSCRHVRAIGLIVLIPALLALAAGCGGSAPKTYPVKGTVVFKNNKGNIQALTGGVVRFQSTSDPSVTAVGGIEEDGSFSLGTFYKERGIAGVPAGEYKACIEPPAADDEDYEARRPAVLHPKYKDFEKSNLIYTVPGSEDITIEVEPGPPRAVKPKRK